MSEFYFSTNNHFSTKLQIPDLSIKFVKSINFLMDVITKDPDFIDQLYELSINQVIYFAEKHTNSIRATISGPVKKEHPTREFQTRTVTSSDNPKEKLCRVRRIS